MAKIKLTELKYVGPDNVAEEPAVEPIPEEIAEELQTETSEPEQAVADPEVAEEVGEDEDTVAETETAVIEEPEKVQEGIGIVTKPVTFRPEKEIKMVNNIRVRTKPSDNIPAKSYSGNVEITGHIGEFTIVRYVKPGFGSVTGYTKDC